MSISDMPHANVAPPPDVALRRFSVDEYDHLIKTGVIGDDERSELLEGWIILRMARNPPHDVTILVAQRTLEGVLPDGWHIRAQMAIATADSKPEPDLAIVRGVARDYLARHPGPADLALVVEVADSSLPTDRGFKGRIYARAGISAYWIINLIDHCVEVYTAPTGPGADPAYRERRDVAPGDAIPLVIEGREVARVEVREILP